MLQVQLRKLSFRGMHDHSGDDEGGLRGGCSTHTVSALPLRPRVQALGFKE